MNEQKRHNEELTNLQEKVQPPSLFSWIASLATVGVIVVNLLLPGGDNPYLRVTGAVILILSAPLIFAPFILLRRHGQTKEGDSYMQTGAVVDRGLYSVTRHPQYLGYMLLAAGFALLSQHCLAIVLAVAGMACFYVQAVEEEHACLATWGEPYRNYMARVPRFCILLGIARLLRGQR